MSKHARVMSGVALFMFVTYVYLSLNFAASYPAAPTEPPAHALSDANLQRLGTIHVDELVALRVNRGDLSTVMLKGIGLLVWLPALVGATTFLVLMLLYRLGLDILLPAGLVSVGIGFIWCFNSVSWGCFCFLAAGIVVLVGAATASRRGRWLRAAHILIATYFFLSASALSLTTDHLMTSYSGFWPASQVDPDKLRVLFENLTRDPAPRTVKDAPSYQIGKIPALNTLDQPITIFSVNRLAAMGFLITALVYLVGVWVIIIPSEHQRSTGVLRGLSRLSRDRELQKPPDQKKDGNEPTSPSRGSKFKKLLRTYVIQHTVRRDFRLPHEVRVAFAIPFYLAVGVGFAIIFFNIYVAAAAKQNVMLLYADVMQLHDNKYAELLAARESFGPTESIMRRIIEFPRSPSDKNISETLHAARARYWPSAVVAQELPRVTSRPLSKIETQQQTPAQLAAIAETHMVLDPQLTFTDMLYFAFAGDSDIQPISDELRFWAAYENLIEVLFTVMFFVVAMDRDRARHV